MCVIGQWKNGCEYVNQISNQFTRSLYVCGDVEYRKIGCIYFGVERIKKVTDRQAREKRRKIGGAHDT